MAATAMRPVEPIGVCAIQPVHPFREVRFWRLQDEVKVVRHQNPRRDRPAEAPNGHAEEEQKRLPIAIPAEDRPAFIAAGGDVVKSITEFES
jgi:hypothetical protein